MRVAVVADLADPTRGGGYTFEDEVVTALEQVGPDSRHEFVLYQVGPAPAPLVRPAAARAVAEGPSRRVVGRLASRGRAAVKAIPILTAGVRRRRTALWNATFERDRIELMWSLSPRVPTMDLPYCLHVWDLQHRLQPFFPEVSRAGTWDAREEAFSRTLRRAAFVLVGTQAGLAEVVRFYGVDPDRIRIVPHPAPAFPAATTRCAVSGVSRPFVLYPAQFWPHKNHTGLVRAVADLETRAGIKLHVALVGSDAGNLAHVKRVASRLLPRDRVSFLGFVDRPTLVSLYETAEMLVYPSFFGPENLPPLEAFSLGCPVVAAAVPGSEEQLGDAAILFDPASPAAMSRAIERVLSDRELRGLLIDRGRQRALRRTPAGLVREVVRILDDFEPVRGTWA